MGIETLAVASLVASVAGAGVGAMGAANTASANSAMSTYQSQIAANNAIIAKRNAASALQAGDVNAENNDMKTANIRGKARAAIAANGVDVNSGSAMDVQRSTEELGRLDTLTILNKASKEAGGYLAQSMNFDAESQLKAASAENANTAGEYGIATSLIGGASSFADKWGTFKTKGVNV